MTFSNLTLVVKLTHKTWLQGHPSLHTWASSEEVYLLRQPIKSFLALKGLHGSHIWLGLKHMLQTGDKTNRYQGCPFWKDVVFKSLTLLGLGWLLSIPMIRLVKTDQISFSAVCVDGAGHRPYWLVKRNRPCSQRKICWLVRPSNNSLSSSSIALISSKSKNKNLRKKCRVQ